MNAKHVRKAILWMGAGAGAWMLAKGRKSRTGWLNGKVVLITGGSRGLGIALAREFARRDCRLVLCARDADELASAREELAANGIDLLTVQCDVTDRNDTDRMISAAMRHFGRIDVLVNNAGVIQVGPLSTMTEDDFRFAMDVMFWGIVHTTLGLLPHMRARGDGRIVNITSIGGKVSVPHLLPYSCAKFAAVAFSEGIHAELRGSGIRVSTIAPGLMRTGSYLNAIFKNAENGEADWFSASSSLPGLAMHADRAARQIVRAAETGKAECILTPQARLLSTLHGLFPGLTSDLLGLVNGLLPAGNGEAKSGAQTASLKRPWMGALTVLGRRAARRYLQPAA